MMCNHLIGYLPFTIVLIIPLLVSMLLEKDAFGKGLFWKRMISEKNASKNAWKMLCCEKNWGNKNPSENKSPLGNKSPGNKRLPENKSPGNKKSL